MDDTVSRIDDGFRTEVMEHAPLAKREMTWPQLIEDAKVMARARLSLPPHLRDNPADCWSILQNTYAWGLENPFFVANCSYVVIGRSGVETLAYNSALYQTVLKKSGAIIGRPQFTYDGDGGNRTCTASVLDRETKQWEHATTPPLAKCRKNSPLWNDDPDQQLSYFAIRRLVRQKYADVFGGLYDKDEFSDEPPSPVEVSPNLMARLPGRVEGEGFQSDPEEMRWEEEQAVAAVTAKQAEVKAKRGGGWPKGLSRAKRNEEIAAKKAAEAQTADPEPEPVAEKPQASQPPTEAQGGVLGLLQPQAPAEPENAPAAAPPRAPRLPADEPPYRGPPRNAAEYDAYFTRMLRGVQTDPVAWYMGPAQMALRDACKVSEEEMADYRNRVIAEQKRRQAP